MIMNRKFFLLTVLFLVPSLLFCLTKSKISGQIRSSESGLPVAYARIEIIESRKMILADQRGFFKIDIAHEKLPLEVAVSCIGYKKTKFVLEPGIQHIILQLKPEPIII